MVGFRSTQPPIEPRIGAHVVSRLEGTRGADVSPGGVPEVSNHATFILRHFAPNRNVGFAAASICAHPQPPFHRLVGVLRRMTRLAFFAANLAIVALDLL